MPQIAESIQEGSPVAPAVLQWVVCVRTGISAVASDDFSELRFAKPNFTVDMYFLYAYLRLAIFMNRLLALLVQLV